MIRFVGFNSSRVQEVCSFVLDDSIEEDLPSLDSEEADERLSVLDFENNDVDLELFESCATLSPTEIIAIDETVSPQQQWIQIIDAKIAAIVSAIVTLLPVYRRYRLVTSESWDTFVRSAFMADENVQENN